MSLGIVIKGPEGLVLAADSRVTLGTKTPEGDIFHVNFDNATKLLSFNGSTSDSSNTHIGAVTYGQAIIGRTNRTVHSFLPEFESTLPNDRLPVSDFATRLSDFYLDQWNKNPLPNYKGPSITFVVGGYNVDEHFGRTFLFEIPSSPEIQERNSGPDQFGLTWGGQREFVDRIVQGYDENVLDILIGTLKLDPMLKSNLKTMLQPVSMQIPLQMLPLQDCVDLAIFFLRTTINGQRLTVGLRGVGGPIEVATITRGEGFKFVQRKQILGEGDR